MGTSPPTSYLLEPRRRPRHRYAYIGIPHDAATSLGNPGARYGPQALREALRGVFDWRLVDGKVADIDRGIVDLSAVEVTDFGDVPLSYHDTPRTVEETYQAVRGALQREYLPMIVGGDHGITYPAVKALHDTCEGQIGLIQLDAHCDLVDFSDRQGHHSGSSGMRRSLELGRVAGSNLVQVGLRGYTTVEQYEFGRHLGVRRITAVQFAEQGAARAAEKALQWAGEGTQAIYLTVDLDVIRSGEAPGTGWPEPGGLTGQEVLDFVRIVAPYVGAIDIAELNPLFDSRSRSTAILAARMLLDFVTARAASSRTGKKG